MRLVRLRVIIKVIVVVIVVVVVVIEVVVIVVVKKNVNLVFVHFFIKLKKNSILLLLFFPFVFGLFLRCGSPKIVLITKSIPRQDTAILYEPLLATSTPAFTSTRPRLCRLTQLPSSRKKRA